MSDLTIAWLCSCAFVFIMGIFAERAKNYITARYAVAKLEA